MFRQSELNSPRTKVGPHKESTRGCQNQIFSLKFQEVGVFSYNGSSLFKSRKWPCDSAQTRD